MTVAQTPPRWRTNARSLLSVGFCIFFSLVIMAELQLFSEDKLESFGIATRLWLECFLIMTVPYIMGIAPLFLVNAYRKAAHPHTSYKDAFRCYVASAWLPLLFSVIWGSRVPTFDTALSQLIVLSKQELSFVAYCVTMAMLGMMEVSQEIQKNYRPASVRKDLK